MHKCMMMQTDVYERCVRQKKSCTAAKLFADGDVYKWPTHSNQTKKTFIFLFSNDFANISQNSFS